MEFDEHSIFYSVMFCICAEYLWALYLDLRQRRVQMINTEVPSELVGILSKDTFDKARLYAIDKKNFGMITFTITEFINVIFLVFNGLHVVWEISGGYIKHFGYEPNEKNEMLHSAAFIVVLSFLNTLVTLPICIYNTFVLEEKHGFNKQTVGFFIKDKLRGYLLKHVLMIPLCCGIISIVNIGGEYFFLYLWLFILCVMFFIYAIFPDFIAPLFDKYVPLPQGELRTRIEELATSLNFPLSDLQVVIGSKRSTHSNAYFYGIYKKKRIVLFDTLLKDFEGNTDDKKDNGEEKKNVNKEKGCDDDEVLAILGHELGHWKLNHSVKNFIITQVNLLLLFLIFSKLFKYPALYRAFGFYDSMPVLIGFVIVLHCVFNPYFDIASWLMAILSRRFEFEADRFAKSLGKGHYLKKALINLNRDNLGFPIYDKWYSGWHNSHPPLLERLKALDKEE